MLPSRNVSTKRSDIWGVIWGFDWNNFTDSTQGKGSCWKTLPSLPASPASRPCFLTALCTASPRGGQQDPRCEQAGITAALGLTLPFAACLRPPRVTRLLSAVGPMPAAPPLAKHVELSEGWAVSINSDYIVFDDNTVMHIQILVQNTHRPDLMQAVSTEAGQNCLLELAG